MTMLNVYASSLIRPQNQHKKQYTGEQHVKVFRRLPSKNCADSKHAAQTQEKSPTTL